MDFELLIEQMEEQAKTLVWWTPSQLARNEHVVNDPTKGERPWIIPRTTGEFLRDTIKGHMPKTVVELGTSIGYSTVWIGKAAAEHDGRVHSIEKSKEKHLIAQKNIHLAELDKHAMLHLGTIKENLPKIFEILGDTKIDFVFMDADRGHYHEYFPMLLPHLAENAMIVADNAGNMGKRMQPFFDVLTLHGWKQQIVQLDNGILIAQKA
jgi:predicted O-methyltransferase YrrM